MAQRYETYKDSGEQWLGEIPNHWNCVRVKSLFSNIREKNNPVQTEERLSLSIDKGVTLYSEKTTNLDRFKEDCTQYLLASPNDIVLNSMNMIVGAVGKSKYFGCVSPAYYVIRLRNKENYIDYFAWLLNIQMIRDVYRVMGKGIMAIDRGDGKVNTCRLKVPYDSFGSIKIPVPPICEQKKIVECLSEKCNKIEEFLFKKQKEVEHLQELKLRVIADAVTRGLNPNVTMKQTNIPWLPEVPEYWEILRAKHMFNKEQRPVEKGDEIVTCFRDGEVTLRKNRRTTGFTEATDYSHYQHICKGDLVIHQMDAFAGSAGVSDSDGMGTPVLSVCTPKSNNILNDYYAHIVRLMGKNGFILSLYRGIRERSSDFRFDTFAKLWLPVPPIEEQKKIVAHINDKTSKIDKLIANINKEIEGIKEYKQRLISDVVTGQIKVC